MARTSFRTVQRVPVPEPQASIDTSHQSRRAQAEGHSTQSLAPDDGADPNADPNALSGSIALLYEFAQANGDISHMLEPGVVEALGIRACREWDIDSGSRESWKEQAERSLNIAAQEDGDSDAEGESYGAGEGLWENSADIRYPLLTTASQQFAARAGPELIKGDQAVSVKVFMPPAKKPDAGQVADNTPPPQNPQAQQQDQAAVQAAQAQSAQLSLANDARQARAERVKHYLNWIIFYQMDDWEGETDLLLHQIPITGSAFKKVYMGTTGLCSDYVSALRLTVHNDTKSIYRCPRITEDFEVYPYEIAERRRAGIYRDIDLPKIGEDPEQPRKFIEQHRMDDLDGDGLPEPYIVTVDIDTKKTMRIEPAYTADDITVRQEEDPDNPGQIKRTVTNIERWNAYASYLFLPDPRGKFYGIGFGRLLQSITDSVDTSINQLLDAGTAEIAGGGFIGSNVRLQGSGQGGSVFFRPGEYQTVGTVSTELRNAIWERTVPHPSEVSFKLMEFLLAAAKDIASVKDVITGDAPSTAPVGTTLALQNQALQVFSAIYKRVYRGFRDEFRLMFKALRRWGGDREVKKYLELTGGDFHADFAGDGTDIQPVADPAVVTKMQKLSKFQTIMQIGDSEMGQAAGMTQPKQAQQIVKDFLETIDVDRPDRYIGDVAPNPMALAKTADIEATAKLKTVDAQRKAVETQTGVEKHAIAARAQVADINLTHAKTLRETGLAAADAHELHQEADRIPRHSMVAKPDQMFDPMQEAEKDRLAEAQEAERDRLAQAEQAQAAPEAAQ